MLSTYDLWLVLVLDASLDVVRRLRVVVLDGCCCGCVHVGDGGGLLYNVGVDTLLLFCSSNLAKMSCLVRRPTRRSNNLPKMSTSSRPF